MLHSVGSISRYNCASFSHSNVARFITSHIKEAKLQASLTRPLRGDVFPQRQIIDARQTRYHGYYENPMKMNVTFVDNNVPLEAELAKNAIRLKDGSVEQTIEASLGNDIMEAAHHFGIDVEGACEGALACSTCHVIVEDEDVYDLLGPLSMREEDLLDLAPGVCDTSRLSCQCKLTEELKQWAEKERKRVIFQLPKSTLNFYVDGFKPEPH